MIQLIAIVSVTCAGLLFVAGCVDLFESWKDTKETKTAVKQGAEKAKSVAEASADNPGSEGVKEYAGLDLKGNWEALAALATALKDLDRSSRLFTLSLAFLAVAGATVGLDSIATGLKG